MEWECSRVGKGVRDESTLIILYYYYINYICNYEINYIQVFFFIKNISTM